MPSMVVIHTDAASHLFEIDYYDMCLSRVIETDRYNSKSICVPIVAAELMFFDDH